MSGGRRGGTSKVLMFGDNAVRGLQGQCNDRIINKVYHVGDPTLLGGRSYIDEGRSVTSEIESLGSAMGEVLEVEVKARGVVVVGVLIDSLVVFEG